MRLNELRDNPKATKSRRRVGRGIGSGNGKTAGRGHKGQKSRSGGKVAVGFEGGQMPLYRRLPKRGFNNPFRKNYSIINLGVIQQALDKNKLDPKLAINAETLLEAMLVKPSNDGVCLLAKGELTTKINIHVAKASKSAITAVENAGGSVTTPVPKPEQQGKGKARHKPTADREQKSTDSAVNKDA